MHYQLSDATIKCVQARFGIKFAYCNKRQYGKHLKKVVNDSMALLHYMEIQAQFYDNMEVELTTSERWGIAVTELHLRIYDKPIRQVMVSTDDMLRERLKEANKENSRLRIALQTANEKIANIKNILEV